MTTSIEYKGPSVHDWKISRQDLQKAGVEFKEGDSFKTIHFAPGEQRVPHILSHDDLHEETRAQIINILKRDKTLTIVDGDSTVSEASENADVTLADGSNAATGEGGSPVLRQALEDEGADLDQSVKTKAPKGSR